MMERWIELARERKRMMRPLAPLEVHATEAIEWLFRAQDATDDRGVSHSYLLGKGWMRSYPETTGYIIPTLLNWSETTGSHVARQRALEMADWELGVQLECGAIPNLIDSQPTVFNTGQVIFGWLSAYRHTEKTAYLQAAIKAGDWLLSVLDADAIWRMKTDFGGPGRTYNVCVAWALLELARTTGVAKYRDSVQPFLRWALALEKGGGWYDRNCLNNDRAPLLHTIAYTARGLLECGLLLDSPDLIDAARRTASAVAVRVTGRGHLAGRFDSEWCPAASWACLTGMAQISIVWRILQAHDGESGREDTKGFLAASHLVNRFLLRTQDRTSRNGGLRGGIRGSYPINGAYGRYRVLNWATKYFIDALMWEQPNRRILYRY